MLDILFWVAVGLFVGWAVPQPAWAAWLQEKVLGFFKNLLG